MARRALLIANGRSDTEAFSPLLSVAKGTVRFQEVLRANNIGGFDSTQALIDSSSTEATAAIQQFFAGSGPNDLSLVYFAGYATRPTNSVYFLTADSSSDNLSATAIPALYLSRESSSVTGDVVLILDCFTLEADAAAAQVDPINEPSSNHTRNLIAITSTSPNPPTDDEIPDFTAALVHGLTTGEADIQERGRINTEDLWGYLSRRLRDMDVQPTLQSFGRRSNEVWIAKSPRPAQTNNAPSDRLPPSMQRNDGSRPLQYLIPQSPLSQSYLPPNQQAPQTAAAPLTKNSADDPPPPPPSSPTPPPPREHVDWIDDAPAERDLLQRQALAEVLATRLSRAAADPNQASFLIHVDGPWGSGKSTLLKLLDRELSSSQLVVHFNAWRNARVQPPWWALLTTIRDRVIEDRPRFLRPFTVVREFLARARRSAAPLVLTALITLGLIGGIYLLLPPLTTTLLKTIGSVVGGVITVVGILWAVGSFASRFLLWNSSRGAQLLERSHTDPMGEVSAHFGWLIEHSRRPVVMFIDDLDRCDGPRVVEILEAVQTLARDQPEPSRAASFVVAADGAWLRRAYEDHYATFAGAVDQPGQPLGYLFQEKLFQLSVPVPAVGARSRATYLSTLLGGPGSPVPAVEAEQSTVSRQIDDSRSEAEVLDLLGGSSPQVRQNLAPQAAIKLAEPEIEAATEHSLEKFAPRLQANPRGVKRFLNTYSILRTLRTLEGNVVGTDTLAAWALLRSRWPQLADHLEHNPQDIALVRDSAPRELPKELRSTVGSVELREFLAAEDLALSEADIRDCCGVRGSA